MEHSLLLPERESRPNGPERRDSRTAPITAPAALLAWQGAAGNSAVTALIEGIHGPPAVQRQGHGHGERPSAAPPVEIHFSVAATEYNDIHPHHLEQAGLQIGRRAGPEPAGSVDYDPGVPQFVEGPPGRVSRVIVTLVVHVTMIRWSESSRLPPAARAEWDRFMAALDTHEQGHVQRARQYFEHYGSELLHHSVSDALGLWNTHVTNAQTSQEEYDTQTHHGQLDGTAGTGTNINADVDGATFDVTRAPAAAAAASGPAAQDAGSRPAPDASVGRGPR